MLCGLWSEWIHMCVLVERENVALGNLFRCRKAATVLSAAQKLANARTSHVRIGLGKWENVPVASVDRPRREPPWIRP